MKFDQSLAVNLLKTIDNFPMDTLLQSEVTEFTSSQLQAMIPSQFDETPPDTLLWHLYTLSISGLIYPPMSIKFIRDLRTAYSTSDTSVRKDNPGYHFLIDALPGIAAEHALTLQGYEYLKNHP